MDVRRSRPAAPSRGRRRCPGTSRSPTDGSSCPRRPEGRAVSSGFRRPSTFARRLPASRGLPERLDLRSTSSLGTLAAPVEGGGSTWNAGVEVPAAAPLEVEGEGRDGLVAPSPRPRLRELRDLDAAARGRARRGAVRVGPDRRRQPVDPPDGAGGRPAAGDGRLGRDDRRPRAGAGRGSAAPRCAVRAGGAERTGEERDPARGARRRRGRPWSPSASRPGTTPSGRSRRLGAPVERRDGEVQVRRFQHEGFAGRVPGDPSSAAFLVAAAALTGSALTVTRRRPQPEPAALPRGDGADGHRHAARGRADRGRASRSGRSRSSPAPASVRCGSSPTSSPW